MTIVTDVQSQARLVGMLPVLLALGGWYLIRGDRLKHALLGLGAGRSRCAVAHGAAIFNFSEEHARRR
nr:hypothetical protein HUO10_005393 [Paraburkholderia busanensis]